MQQNDENLLKNINEVKDSRKLFPVTDNCIYLDSAHYSPYSLETHRRIQNYITRFTYSNDNLSKFNLRISASLKKKCAVLINANEQDIIITSSTTHGLNIFANGIHLKEGDTVVFADTEFPAVVYPWLNQEKLRGIKTVMIPSINGKIDESDIEKSIKDYKAKVLTISSVEFLGFRNNLSSINKICKKYGCYLVVDGIQSAGILPIDVKADEIDFFTAGSQKWLQAPAGIGFAYISPAVRSKVSPTYVGTTSVQFEFANFLKYELNFMKDGTAYENSTLNTLGMIGLESSIDLFLKLGVENIEKHIVGLNKAFVNKLDTEKFHIESDTSDEHISNILIFSHKNKTLNSNIQKELENKNIFIALREGFLRISPHIFNNEDDIQKLTASLAEF